MACCHFLETLLREEDNKALPSLPPQSTLKGQYRELVFCPLDHVQNGDLGSKIFGGVLIENSPRYTLFYVYRRILYIRPNMYSWRIPLIFFKHILRIY
jgi:hypothetical protein